MAPGIRVRAGSAAATIVAIGWAVLPTRLTAADESLAHLFNHPGPANDDFANATVIDGTNVIVAGHNIGATLEYGEPYHAENPSHGAASIWWRWTAPTNGFLILATPGCQFEPMIAVYEGSDLSSLSLVARRAHYTSDRLALLAPVAAGHSYHIALPRTWRDMGRAFLSLRFRDDLTSPLPNDDFAAATPLAGSRVEFEVGTLGCTLEAGEPPNVSHVVNTKSAWWSWAAPSNGVVTVLGREPGDLPWLSLYSGSSVDALTPIASDQFPGFAAAVTQGITYHIAATAPDDRAGVPMELQCHPPGPPPNDAFANATVLTTNEAFVGHCLGATFETDEPAHFEAYEPQHSKSVWYAWTAPSDGFARLRILDGQAWVAAYRGASLASLDAVPDYDGCFPVDASSQYHVAMMHGAKPDAAFRAILDFFPATGPPPNDAFATPAVIAGSSFATNAHNWGATTEPGEPPHYFDSSNSVWWAWTAPSNGLATIVISEASCGASLAVYTGDTLGTLVDAIGSAGADSWSTDFDRVSFRAAQGQTYRLCVAGASGAWGLFRLELDLRTDLTIPPPNDDIDQAAALAGDTADARSHNVGATAQVGEPNHGMYGDASVWWRWTAPSDGYVTLSIDGSLAYNGFALYAGEPADASRQFSGSIDGLADSSFFTSRVTAGTQYHIAVDGLDSLLRLRLWFSAGVPIVPINDDFDDATLLSGSSIGALGDTTGATREPGEPRHGGEWVYANNSVWWRWTAPDNGVALLTMPAGQISHAVAVYTGESVSSLIGVDSRRSADQRFVDEFSFLVNAGQAYHIAIGGGHEAQGPVFFELALHATPIPAPNDDFADGTVISGLDVRISAHNYGASIEAGEPTHPTFDGSGNPGRSVWWRWTAPANGWLSLGAKGHDLWLGVALYTGNEVDGLALIPGDFGTHEVAAGTNYHIATYSFEETAGLFDLLLHFTQAVMSPNDDFANATPLTSLDTNMFVTLFGATLETDEMLFWYDDTNSVWLSFCPPCTGTLSYSTKGSPCGATADVLTGTSASNVAYVPGWGSFSSSPGPFGSCDGIANVIAGQPYVIRVAGEMGHGGVAHLSLSFTPNAPFDFWTAGAFPPGTPPALTAPAADPDLDRIPNMLEAGFGFDPLSPEWGPIPVLHLGGGGGSVSFPHADPDNGVGLVLEGSSTLAPESWQPLASYAAGLGWATHVTGVSVAESGDGDLRTVTIHLPASALGGPSYFVRLRAAP